VIGSDTPHSENAASAAELAGRRRLLGAVDELLSLATGLLPPGVLQNLDAARTRLVEDRFNLVVFGEFKRGKSTLINALLGRELLPTGVVPLTSVVTAIGAGSGDRLLVRFADRREQERPLGELAQYVTEAGNPGNQLAVELARVELDHELLHAGLELVDTPGIGSVHSHNTEVARGFLPRIDAAVCVLDAGQPLSENERELFREAAERVPRFLFVVNKIDHLDHADREVAIEFVRSGLRKLLGQAGSDVFAVSARHGEGLGPLAARLRRLAAEEREMLLLRSVAGLSQSVAEGGAQAARFEARAIELPLDELADRARRFEQRMAELRAASGEASDLLEQGTKRLLSERVNEPLREYASREGPRLRTQLHAHIARTTAKSPRELSFELERWIDATVRREFSELVPRFEAAIADELTELEDRYAERVRRILEQVQEVAEEVFGARAGSLLPATGLRAPSRFSFKLRDVEHALDILVGFGRTLTPGALGRRLVSRDAERRLIEMADRHAGRLRSELADRVLAATTDYRRELATAINEAIEAIRGAIARATTEHRRSEQEAQTRLQELEQVERRCEELASELRLWTTTSPPPARPAAP
jgi:small GTP-binding protein